MSVCVCRWIVLTRRPVSSDRRLVNSFSEIVRTVMTGVPVSTAAGIATTSTTNSLLHL